jgi:hypothetical protein
MHELLTSLRSALLPILVCALYAVPASAQTQHPGSQSVHALLLPEGRPEQFQVELTVNGVPQTLLLQRHDLRGNKFRVRAWTPRGERILTPPPPGTYRGHLFEAPETTVIASLGAAGLQARLLLPDGRAAELRPLSLEAPGTPRELHALAPSTSGQPTNFLCASDDLAASLPLSIGQPPSGGPPSTGPSLPSGARTTTGGVPTSHSPLNCATLCDLAFDCDYEYFQAKGSDVAAVVDSVEAHMNLVDWYYARDTRITYRIPEIVVRTAPFYAPVDGGDLLNQFRDEWNTNQASVERDIAQLLTGKPGSLIQYGGLAFVGVMCTSSGYGWSMDNTYALGHEIGHNWGSSHCHDLAPCNNMCGGCFYIAPNTKNIISNTRDTAPCLSLAGTYQTPLPPYAHPESMQLRKNELATLAPTAFDVLANDHDVNCQDISISGFTTTGTQGGGLSLSSGTGPAGRDELVYTAPTAPFIGDDLFTYTLSDSSGKTDIGRLTVSSRPVDLQGKWTLDETSGTLASDATSHAHDGTTSGDPFWLAGQIDGGLLFDGLDDAVTLPAMNLNTDQLTITTWLYRIGSQPNFAGIVFSRQAGTVAGLNFGTGNELRYHWDGSADTYNWDSGLVVPSATWVFVALVVEADKATMYMHDGLMQTAVNAVSHSEQAFSGTTALGLDPGSLIRDFNGILDDVRLHDHALDSSEILDVMQYGGRAESPQPADGSRLAELSWGLTWLPGSYADSHDVYLGTDYVSVRDATTADTSYQGNVLAPAFAPTGLDTDTTYYWRIDEHAGGTVLPGEVWQFRLARRHRWQLDEVTGTVAVDSAGGQDGSYFGGTLLGLPGATSELGTAVDLDGVNDRMRADPLHLNTDTVTMTAWVRRRGEQAEWAPFVFFRANTTGTGLGLGFGNEIRYHWDSGQWGWDSGLVLPNATWTFVALVVNPDQATLYMSQDGALLSATNVSGHPVEAFDAALEMGRDPGFSSRWFKGRIDDLRIYATDLSPAEIERVYTESL